MNEEIIADIRNKLTAPQVVLEKMAKGEQVSPKVSKLALKDLKAAIQFFEKMEKNRK